MIGEAGVSPSKIQTRIILIQDKKKIIEDKGAAKEWQEREVALKEMEFLFREGKSFDEE